LRGDSTNLQEVVPAYAFEKEWRVNAITFASRDNDRMIADGEFQRARNVDGLNLPGPT